MRAKIYAPAAPGDRERPAVTFQQGLALCGANTVKWRQLPAEPEAQQVDLNPHVQQQQSMFLQGSPAREQPSQPGEGPRHLGCPLDPCSLRRFGCSLHAPAASQPGTG